VKILKKISGQRIEISEGGGILAASIPRGMRRILCVVTCVVTLPSLPGSVGVGECHLGTGEGQPRRFNSA